VLGNYTVARGAGNAQVMQIFIHGIDRSARGAKSRSITKRPPVALESIGFTSLYYASSLGTLGRTVFWELLILLFKLPERSRTRRRRSTNNMRILLLGSAIICNLHSPSYRLTTYWKFDILEDQLVRYSWLSEHGKYVYKASR